MDFGQGGSGGGSGGNSACYAKPIKGLFGIVWNEFDYISLPGGDGADGTMVVLCRRWGRWFWRGWG